MWLAFLCIFFLLLSLALALELHLPQNNVLSKLRRYFVDGCSGLRGGLIRAARTGWGDAVRHWGVLAFEYRAVVVQHVRHRVRSRSRSRYVIPRAQKVALLALAARYSFAAAVVAAAGAILAWVLPFSRIPVALAVGCLFWLGRVAFHALWSCRPSSKVSDATTKVIYVRGYDQQPWKLVVNDSFKVSDVLHGLSLRHSLSTSRVGLYLSSRWLPLSPDQRIGDLCLDDLSILTLRIALPGGAPSSSDAPVTPPRAPRPSSDTPSKNTRSRTAASAAASSSSSTSSPTLRRSPRKAAQASPASPAPAEDESPRKRKKSKGIASLSDKEAWEYSDADIIAASRSRWTSKCYEHYKVKLIRERDRAGKPHRLVFQFSCKYNDSSHKTITRPRTDTSTGTHNLLTANRSCNKRSGRTENSNQQTRGQLSLHQTTSKYCQYKHRVIIALRCAVHKRPFNSVADRLYRDEVELLRPGTQLPHPSTISRDTRTIHLQLSKHARSYFKSLGSSAVHVVVDGWTAPFVASYLGICLVWYANGRMWRAILEFKRLTQRHTGLHLAGVIARVLKDFGVADKLLAVCADNATNNDTMVDALADEIPTFQGSNARLRCFPHTINLMAKAFLSPFFAVEKKKTPVVVKAGTKRKHESSSCAAAIEVVDDADGIHGDGLTAADEAEVDPGKTAHDEEAIRGVLAQAFEKGKELGIIVTESERRVAKGLFTKIAGLARRVHDSAVLRERFEQLVGHPSTPDEETGDQRQLIRRVPTRWNSDLACLAAHIYFKEQVKELTEQESTLHEYALTPAQWKLAHQLEDVLKIFEEPTRLFSEAGVPLVHETVPMIEEIEHMLCDIRDEDGTNGKELLAPIVRVAAIAALLIVGKYYALTDDTEIHRIAMILCPHRKLAWFQKHDWDPLDIETARKIAIDRWKTGYEHRAGAEAAPARVQPKTQTTKSKWQRYKDDLEMADGAGNADTLEAYLDEPLVPAAVIMSSGGLLQYWEAQRSTRPRLAQMALDYLSAPASSVDAERAFSGGRLQVNHLQHGISSQTFRAKMALGSWIDAPWFTDYDTCATYIGGKKRAAAAQAAQNANANTGNAVEVIDIDSDTN